MTDSTHISEDNLERYYLGTVPPPELPGVEKHLFWCTACLGRLDAAERYIEAVRLAAKMNRFDLH